MVQRFARLAWFSFAASSSRRTRADIRMTTGSWADLVLTSLAAVAIAFFITIAIGAASAQQNRDSPDGRNHLCAPPPSAYQPPDTLFCFKPGAGI
jgi:hypothetical protein